MRNLIIVYEEIGREMKSTIRKSVLLIKEARSITFILWLISLALFFIYQTSTIAISAVLIYIFNCRVIWLFHNYNDKQKEIEKARFVKANGEKWHKGCLVKKIEEPKFYNHFSLIFSYFKMKQVPMTGDVETAVSLGKIVFIGVTILGTIASIVASIKWLPVIITQEAQSNYYLTILLVLLLLVVLPAYIMKIFYSYAKEESNYYGSIERPWLLGFFEKIVKWKRVRKNAGRK